MTNTKKTLIITAHPSSHGTTHTIAKTYAKAQEKKGIKTKIIDLYQTELKQDFLKFEDIRKIKIQKNTSKRQKIIKEADHIVLIFPIRRGDCPAIMKNRLDNTFGAGFAFTYQNGKPSGLLKGKTADVIATSDASSFIYTYFPFIGKLIRGMLRLGFCGIKLKNYKVFGKLKDTKKDKEKMKKLLTKVEKIANK